MYTTLEHTAIREGHEYAFKEIYEKAGKTHMICRKNGREIKWPTADDAGKRTELYTYKQLTKLVEILVSNIWIQNGPHIRRQSTGLPMGTNPAPQMADITCYRYEAKAMDAIAQSSLARARAFAGTCRYIDDIITIDNRFFDIHIGQDETAGANTILIYPPFLALNKTTDSSRSVDYLGMKVFNTPSIIFDVADTQQKFPVTKINYPNLRGNFPINLGYGVFTGQLHRFARICTASTNFLIQTQKLTNTVLSKGYDIPRINQTFKRFIHNNNPYKTRAGTLITRFKQLLRK
jgi:hypothetical protein